MLVKIDENDRGLFINYVRVLRKGGGQKNLYITLLQREGGDKAIIA